MIYLLLYISYIVLIIISLLNNQYRKNRVIIFINFQFHFTNLQQFLTINQEFPKIFNSNPQEKLGNLNFLGQQITTEISLKIQDCQSISSTLIHQTKKKCINNSQPKQLQQQIICQDKNCQNKRKKLNETQIKGETILLCDRCLNNFNLNNYCEYCIQIYDPTIDYEMDDKQWIMCEKCN